MVAGVAGVEEEHAVDTRRDSEGLTLNGERIPASRIRHRASGKSGQALLELTVGLVAILVLFAVIVQLGRLQRAHTETLMEARAEAGERALQGSYTITLPGPDYIRDWEPGNDEKAYSRDDTPQLGTAATLANNILSIAQPQQLAEYVPDNPITEYSTSVNMDAFSLVNGTAQSEDIALLPIIQRLIYSADSISMEARVWLTWAEGVE